MEKIYIITSCLECPCDSGAQCGHPTFKRKYPDIPNYPAPPEKWCPLLDRNTSQDRERIMQKWDSWVKYYREGGRASWPRDAFESLLDELFVKNKILKEDLDFWRDQFRRYTKLSPPLF